MDTITMVVPCYNEEESIFIYLDAMNSHCKDLTYTMEILFVDDGSKDNTRNVIKEAVHKKWDYIKVGYIGLSRNFGKEAAMLAGFEAAKGKFVGVMDVDLQDPPEMIDEMIKYLEGGKYDCVATRRVDRTGEPPVRSFFANLFYKLINKISDTKIVNGARDFRLMNRKYIDAILAMREYNRFSKGLFSWVGFETKWLEFTHKDRAAGSTSWSFWKLFKYSIDGFLGFSTAPLKLATLAGVTSCGISFIALIILIIRRLCFGDPVAGWASLACLIILYGGLILLAVGVLGEYLAKMYLEVKQRPVYLLDESDFEQFRS